MTVDGLMTEMTPRLREAMTRLDAEIERTKIDLAGLREEHAKAAKLLQLLDPETKPKPKRDRSTGKIQVSAEKLEALQGWLGEHANGETFSTPQILARDDFDLMSEPTLRAALEILHERGVVTLDSVGSPDGRQNRRKNFRLVRA